MPPPGMDDKFNLVLLFIVSTTVLIGCGLFVAAAIALQWWIS